MSTASFGAAIGLLAAITIGDAPAANAAPYQHVLLISVDGLHALDLANYVAANPAARSPASHGRASCIRMH
jgi:predicted AlkP superfamily pyrophosphatase or phosphodiesterase